MLSSYCFPEVGESREPSRKGLSAWTSSLVLEREPVLPGLLPEVTEQLVSSLPLLDEVTVLGKLLSIAQDSSCISDLDFKKKVSNMS